MAWIRMEQLTFLRNQALPTSGQADHDYCNPGIFDLNPIPIGLFVVCSHFNERVNGG